MKKILMGLLVVMMLCALSACGGEAVSNGTQNDNVQQNSQQDTPQDTDDLDTDTQVKDEKVDSIEALEEIVEQDINDWIERLRAEWETLETEMSSYDVYKENIDKVETFYKKIYEETKNMCDELRRYSVQYAEIIVESDMEIRDMYSEAEIIYDSIYDDAGDEIYDEIYNGILDDMYDAFYNGIIKDAYNNVPYSEYSDISSDAYGMNVDVRSDVYDFALDFRGELFDKDLEKAKEEIEDFKEDIEK